MTASSSKKPKRKAAPSTRYDSLSDPKTLALFVERLDAGIYITDAEGRFLDANPAFLRLFDLARRRNWRVRE